MLVAIVVVSQRCRDADREVLHLYALLLSHSSGAHQPILLPKLAQRLARDARDLVRDRLIPEPLLDLVDVLLVIFLLEPVLLDQRRAALLERAAHDRVNLRMCDALVDRSQALQGAEVRSDRVAGVQREKLAFVVRR